MEVLSCYVQNISVGPENGRQGVEPKENSRDHEKIDDSLVPDSGYPLQCICFEMRVGGCYSIRNLAAIRLR